MPSAGRQRTAESTLSGSPRENGYIPGLTTDEQDERPNASKSVP